MAQLVRHDLGDVCRRVEEVREPAHERCDLDLALSKIPPRDTHDADPANWLGQMLDGLVNRPDDISDLATMVSVRIREGGSHSRAPLAEDAFPLALFLRPACDPDGQHEDEQTDDTD